MGGLHFSLAWADVVDVATRRAARGVGYGDGSSGYLCHNWELRGVLKGLLGWWGIWMMTFRFGGVLCMGSLLRNGCRVMHIVDTVNLLIVHY
jgi:hypothetical protein